MARKAVKPKQEVQQSAVSSSVLTGPQFHRGVEQLWKHARGKPQDPTVYALPQYEESKATDLPLNVEIELTEGFAYITAVKKGPESVSATAIAMPNNENSGMSIYIASNDGVETHTQVRLRSIVQTMQNVALRILSRNAGKESIFMTILDMSNSRINARLRARRRNNPVILQGLQQILADLGAAEHNFPEIITLRNRLLNLCQSLQTYDVTAKSTTSTGKLKTLVIACYQFWTMPGKPSTRDMLHQAGIDIGHSNGHPCLLRVAKIAAYYHIARLMVSCASSKKFGTLFRHISLNYVPSFEPIHMLVPPTIAGGGTQCRIHAEVQLIIALDSLKTRKWRRSRAIGSSKAACFSCNLFMQKHGVYFVPRSHGSSTPFWAIPNSGQFTAAHRERYQAVIKMMIAEIMRLTKMTHPVRCDPVMSWQALSQLEAQCDSSVSSQSPTQLPSQRSVSSLSDVSSRIQKQPQSIRRLIEPEVKPSEHSPNVSSHNSGLPGTNDCLIQSRGQHFMQRQKGAASDISPDSLFELVGGNSPSLVAGDLIRKKEATPSLVELDGQVNDAISISDIHNDSASPSKSSMLDDNVATAHMSQDMSSTSPSTHNSAINSNSIATVHQSFSKSDHRTTTSQQQSPIIKTRNCTSQNRAKVCLRSIQTETFRASLVDDVGLQINLGDLVLSIEAEIPATVFVSAVSDKCDTTPERIPVVDVGTLKPGDDRVLTVGSRADGKKSFDLIMRNKQGFSHRWAIDWTFYDSR